MAHTVSNAGAFKRAFAKEMYLADIEHEYQTLREAYYFYGTHPEEAELRVRAKARVDRRRGIVDSPVSDTR